MSIWEIVKKTAMTVAGLLISIVVFATVPPAHKPSSAAEGASPLPALVSQPTPTATLSPPASKASSGGALAASHSQALTPPPPILSAKGYILMDGNSGAILTQQNANERMAPASLTKLMTMYVISEAMAAGRIHLTDNVPISVNAWKTGGSRMFVREGTQVPVKDLINGIVVASGNDASMAMAEYVGGNVPSFIGMMNETARQLGMKNTHFIDPTGLPDPDHYSSPYDLALLTRAIINNYPEDYKWYDQKWMSYNNIKQPNRNRLLWRDSTVDGLKTGHTSEAGYCLVASAERNGMRLIAVVMGDPTDSARANDAQALLNYGYRYFETHKLYAAGATLAAPRVWMGQEKTAKLGIQEDLYVTIPAGQYDNLKANMQLTPNLQAPIQKGQKFGSVQVTLNEKTIADLPLIALANDPKASFFARMGDHFELFFHRWFNKA